MNGSMKPRDPPVPASQAQPSDREVRLAQALRANLRRRKQPSSPASETPGEADD